ncbi:MAG: phosphatidylserine/phosphatidylglycerophosphate/cardiolipin synthase family protein [Burkholderiales bacterium]|nr:phosphatidylserine/phosphatidylglycerophosphate/cardiolipin synthase family protein [Opitutaceae bacterium]
MSPSPARHPHHPIAADAVSWLANGAVAYRRMLALIDAAHTSIRCETYIWSDDAVGTRFREALTRAASRGVRVRVLVDGAGSSALPAGYWQTLQAAGGTAHVFNPLTFRHFSLRNHRKLLLVDDAVAITGGFNIATDYDGDGIADGWRDFGLELSDPAALRQLASSFDSFFGDHLIRHWLLRHLRTQPLRRPLFYQQPGPVLFSGPRLVHNQFSRRLLATLRQAKHVRIISAYFVPGLRLRWALRDVARRGGTVELLLAGKTDVPLAQHAARSLYGSLLRAGVRIWEYQPQILHAKLALIDDSVFVGSANLDARSLAINYELTVHIHDSRLAAEAGATFTADLLQSQAITLDAWKKSRTWLARLRGACARFLITQIDPWVARRQMRDIP